MRNNQLSRYGAITKLLPSLSPGAKAFFVLAKANSWFGDFASEFPSDFDGFSRVHSSIANVISAGALVANRGDTIYLLPGHTETISTATALTLSVAGINIVGLGQGSTRPTITLDTATTATINVSAANVRVNGVVFIANFADIASVFTLTTANDFELSDCEVRDTSSILNFKQVIKTDATDNHADGLKVLRNRILIAGTTAGSTPVIIAGAASRIQINDNFIVKAVLNNVSCVLAHTSKVMTNLEMARNKVFSANTDSATGGFLITTTSTTNTGLVYDNYIQGLDTAAAILVTAGSIYGMFNNLYDGDADASGYVLPAIGAN